MESDGWLDHRLLGYNYRLSELNCALGLEQAKRIDDILGRREAVAIQYSEELQAIPEVITPPLKMKGGRICWFVYVIRLDNRDTVLRQLMEQGIGCARYFAPLHLQPLFAPYANPGDDLKVTEQVAGQTLALPFFNALTREQIHEVCGALREAVRLKT
jgi:perosamine synthetase